MNIQPATYTTSGVDVDLGNQASKILYEAAKETWENTKGKFGEVIIPFDDFSGLRAIRVGNLPHDTVACLGFDGVGTKIEIAERVGKHDTIAFDLFSMVCDDAVVRGGVPVLLGSVLDVNSLSQNNNGIEIIKQLASGYVLAAKEAEVAVINGELAELGSRISGFGKFNYSWSSGILWFAKESKLLTGKKICVGDKLIALKENGFRSNGLSLVRRIFSENFGNAWHEEELNGKNLGELVLTPSKIYCKIISELRGEIFGEPKVNITGIAHITGGGIPEKLERMLKPSGFGIKIKEPFSPPAIMKYCQDLGNISDEEAYRTWNMGNGMFIATPEAEKVLQLLSEKNVDAKICGEIIREKKISIRTNETVLHFPL
jgi:phosphoribosylformylglycinamidine cyclo-ligase